MLRAFSHKVITLSITPPEQLSHRLLILYGSDMLCDTVIIFGDMFCEWLLPLDLLSLNHAQQNKH
jgi:hypothetical protein